MSTVSPTGADQVFIEGLRVDAVIGVYDWEKRIQQTLVFDLHFSTGPRCNQRAAASDKVDDAIDYKAVSDRVGEIVKGSSFDLIETLAETVATALIQEFTLRYLRLRLAKPGAITDAETVGVLIERTSAGAGDADD